MRRTLRGCSIIETAPKGKERKENATAEVVDIAWEFVNRGFGVRAVKFLACQPKFVF